MATLEVFLKTGQLGPLSLGMSPTEVFEILGDADEQSRKMTPLVQWFGNVQLVFTKRWKDEPLHLAEISVIYEGRSTPQAESLHFTDWNPSSSITEAEFRSFLDRISYRPGSSVGGASGKKLLLLSGIVVRFVIDKLRSIYLTEKAPSEKTSMSLVDEREADEDQIREMLREARSVLAFGAPRSAFMVAWAALEASLRRAALRAGRHGQIGALPSVLIQELRSENRITLEERAFLEQIRQIRTATAHGMAPIEINKEKVERLIIISERLLHDKPLAVKKPKGDEKDLLKTLGSCLLCISVRCVRLEDGNETDDELILPFTAFAMEFGGYPVLVTAGHVIDDYLNPLIMEGKYEGHSYKVIECNICDYFGKDAKVIKPMPFPYAATPKASIDRSLDKNGPGTDFGIMLLHNFLWRSLTANGVAPIPQERWQADPKKDFDVYKMFGFGQDLELAKKGYVVPTLYSITKASDSEVAMREGEPVWFVGTLPEGIKSAKGLSGGPIFGFTKEGENLWNYHVVGMQSWGDPNERMVYATPIQSFGPSVVYVIERLRKESATRKTDSE
jgi:hypothetical protein